MKKIALGFIISASLHAALCHAEYTVTPMPQGTPPQISEQTKQLIRNSIQASPNLPTPTATEATAPTPVSASKTLQASKLANSSGNNFDNQRAYQNKIRQELENRKP